MNRTIVLSRRALQADIVSLPEGTTYLKLFPTMTATGEFPHAPTADDRRCEATLTVEAQGGQKIPPAELWCTRADEHTLHVSHIDVGVPVAAWVDPA